MKKKVLLVLSIMMASVLLLAGCGSESSSGSDNSSASNKEVKEVKMIIPDGITAIACAKLVKEDSVINSDYKMNYNIEKSSENVVSSVLKGDADIAIVPSNVSATQYNKTKKYQIAGTIGWGSFYLVSNSGDKKLDDLKGKEIYNIGKGLTPDIIMKSILKNKNYDCDKDFNFSYVSGVTELAPLVIAKKAEYAVVPEPALTQILSKNKDATVIMDLNEEWKKINNSEYGYPQSTLIIKKEFYEANKDFCDKLIESIKDSCSFASEKNNELPNYSEEIGVSADKGIILNAMDKANIKYTPIKDSYKEYDTYFNALMDFDAKTIGGSLPDEEIYLEK